MNLSIWRKEPDTGKDHPCFWNKQGAEAISAPCLLLPAPPRHCLPTVWMYGVVKVSTDAASPKEPDLHKQTASAGRSNGRKAAFHTHFNVLPYGFPPAHPSEALPKHEPAVLIQLENLIKIRFMPEPNFVLKVPFKKLNMILFLLRKKIINFI